MSMGTRQLAFPYSQPTYHALRATMLLYLSWPDGSRAGDKIGRIGRFGEGIAARR